MKKTILCLLTLSLLALSSNAQQAVKLPVDTAIRYGQLENGLTYYIRHHEQPKQRCEFHIAQAVGAILEEDNQNGLAHFLEHMAFNGTEHFPGKGIIEYFESQGVNFGGNINAYTSLDETVYRLSDVPTYREGILDSALLVLHDWACGLSLIPEEIDAERGVIREEWRTRSDASRRIWKYSNAAKYPGSQYAIRDIIGDTAVINNFAYDALRAYYKKWYGPDNQAIIVVGDIDVDVMEQKVKALFGPIPARVNRGERPLYSVDDNKEPIVAIVTDKEAQQTLIELECKHNEMPEALKGTNVAYVTDIIDGLINRMMRERFNEELLKSTACFAGARAYYGNLVTAKDAYQAFIVPKEGQEKEAYAFLLTQLEKMSRYGFTNAELERAKTENLASYEKSYNNRNARRNQSLAQEYIRNFLYDEVIPGIEWEYETLKQLLPALPLEAVNNRAKQYMTDENLIICFSGPDKKEVVFPTKEEALQILADVKNSDIEAPAEEVIDQTLVKKAPKAGKLKKAIINTEVGTTEWTLSNGIKVIFKTTEFKKDEILMTAYSQGGMSMIDDVNDLPSAMLATDIISMSGIANFSATELQKKLTGKVADVDPGINGYSEIMSGNSSVKDFETMLQLNYLYFTAPRRDEESFNTLMSLLENRLKNKDKNSKAIFRDSINAFTNNHSERVIPLDTALLAKVNLDKAISIYKQRFANPADFTFTFTGNINPEDAATKALILRWLGGMKTKKSHKAMETYIDRGVRVPMGLQRNYFSRDMQTQTASNRIQYTSYDMPYTLANDLNMEMIGRILSTRYLESIREREGGSYGVGCAGYMQTRPVNYAMLIMQFDTDPLKQAKLMSIIHEEVNTIIENGPLANDLQKEKESMLKDFKENIETNSFWHGEILPSYYRLDVNYVADYEETVRNITAETVQATLKKLVESGNMFEVVMFPAEEAQDEYGI